MDAIALRNAGNAYAKTLKETVGGRELEASLLLKAAAGLQAVLDSWRGKPVGLADPLLYNRRLWIVLIDAVMRDDNKLPISVRENILSLGAFVLAETFSLMTQPRPEHLTNIININRRIAAGLRGKSAGNETGGTKSAGNKPEGHNSAAA
jgi:flagellar protein FlaF